MLTWNIFNDGSSSLQKNKAVEKKSADITVRFNFEDETPKKTRA